jgi:hypothetical protein
MIEGVDAAGHPTPAALVAAGKRFVGQYFKYLDRAQVDAYHAAGLDVVLIYETTGNRYTTGRAGGATDAAAATAECKRLGCPPGTVVYFAEDDTGAATGPNVLAYAQGLADARPAAANGWYGGIGTVKAVLDAGHCAYGFQTYGWSAGKWDPRAQLQQYNNGQSLGGTAVDYDRATVPGYGAWTATPWEPTMIRVHLSDGRQFIVGAGWRNGISDPNLIAECDAAGIPDGGQRSTAFVNMFQDAAAAVALVAKTDQDAAAAKTDPAALAAALAPLVHGGVDVNALAAALAPLVGGSVIATLTAHPFIPKP